MTIEKNCLKCGGGNLEPGVLQSTGRMHFMADNTRILSFRTSDIPVRSSICLDCGFIEMVGDVHKAKSLTGRAKSVSSS